jgi:hypothetical protein
MTQIEDGDTEAPEVPESGHGAGQTATVTRSTACVSS